jgi:hypothetical protein
MEAEIGNVMFPWWLANNGQPAFVGERNDHMTKRLWRKRKDFKLWRESVFICNLKAGRDQN